jgi:ComF family protein
VTLLDLVFPSRCAACDAPGTWPLCAACTHEVGVVIPPWCERCGRPWNQSLLDCVDCPPAVLDRCRAAFLYEGSVARAIKSMKFVGTHALAPHLAGAMAELTDPRDADVITWVPLSRRRRARRGFDQAEMLARSLAGRLGLPLARLLVRRRDATSQAQRTGAERRAALRDAFRSASGPAPERVLLVDDVLTTGSTASACAEVLKACGARRVTLVTAARSLGGPVPSRCRAVAFPERARVPYVGLVPGSVVARGDVPR